MEGKTVYFSGDECYPPQRRPDGTHYAKIRMRVTNVFPMGGIAMCLVGFTKAGKVLSVPAIAARIETDEDHIVEDEFPEFQ